MRPLARLALTVTVAALILVPIGGPARAVAPVILTGFTLTEISLPGLATLSAYLDNYRTQYPTVGFSGQCANGVLYINNNSKLACYGLANATVWNVTGALTMLYQQTPGLAAQIDNEFQLDTPWDDALLYGNLTTSAGHVTVELANLSSGAVHQATSPVLMENGIQADYVGGGNVVIFNSTGVSGSPTYFTNVLNGTSWPAGLSVGFAPNNIYWVGQLGAFLDVQGLRVTEIYVRGGSLLSGPSVYFNRTGLNSVTAVDGVAYDPGSGKVAFDLATNLGNYVEVATASPGGLVQAGSRAWITPISMYVQRYSYSTGYVWCFEGGQTLLWDPFTNATIATPNLISRTDSSGANGNFEFTDPLSYARYLSFNETLLGISTRAPNQFVWAQQIPIPPSGSVPTGASGFPASTAVIYLLETYWYVWIPVLALVMLALAVRRS